MPGLSQLKQFNSDLLALGDEITTRASRGEQPVKVKIPDTVQDVNDSEDFVLGMPEIEAEVEEELIDEDLSDLAGITNSTSGDDSASEEEPAVTFEAPDMSGLLNTLGHEQIVGEEMPDLSMFADEPEPAEEEAVEEEPEEISIADMNLDDLLSGGGFDQPEEGADNAQPEPEEQSVADAMAAGVTDDGLFGDLVGEPEKEPAVPEPEANLEPVKEAAPVKDLEDLGSIDNLEDFKEPVASEAPENPVENVSEPDFDFNVPSGNDDFSSGDGNYAPPSADESIPDLTTEMPDFTAPVPEMSSEDFEEPETINAGDSDLGVEVEDIEDLPDLEETTAGAPSGESATGNESDEISDLDSFGLPAENAELGSEVSDLDDLNLPDIEDISSDSLESADSLPDLDDLDSIEAAEPVDELGAVGDKAENSATDDFSSEIPEGLFDAKDLDVVPGEEGDAEVSDLPDLSSDNLESTEPLETFDTSEMEGITFDDIPDTDTQLSQNADDDSQFDLKSDDEFGTEFEIPGYSDVETVKEQKSAKIGAKNSTKEKKHKAKKQKDGSVIEEDEDNLPPNTLSDRQYKIFKKNLSEYPLNVRLAFEDFLVQDEFTDDAEFEVIEKILNKAPARQVANTLEKMLDISIPVPRDFEHRSAEEYEEYKKSISYQLKNKIIPAALVFIVGVFVCIGLFNFGKNCIYKPLRANSLYKQGYVLLQESEYPLSEIKFNKATTYRLSKKWFFKYARGYREHKQYQRAEKMYENILYCFKHDKKAGLEYADMELEELANYERAEEIVRREVLDYHINDADGILKLGDVFLEWGTEKDPSKLEEARQQYATLLQLYGEKDLYLSRMMRYFMRSDNLREVLMLKQHFEPKEKSLCSDDWTELSGYLLDKYYGELAPSEEYLRYEIEGLRGLLLRAVNSNPENPIALYNLSRYFINTNENEFIESTLQTSIEKFNAAKKMKKRHIYKYIDAYRLLGEHYMKTEDFLQAQEQFAEGISLYITERNNAGFEGTPEIGKLYEDLGDLKYTISGDYDEALQNYTYSVNLGNDSPRIRYRIGYVQYHNKNYAEALGSFMRAGDGNIKERNLLLAMANTLSLRGDDYAAEGYYNQLIENLDSAIAEKGLILPQASVKDYDIVNTYLTASNNYGVTLYRLAKKTGNSSKNAEAIVQFSQSVRAWDALTRNQETMVRLPGSNLAEQNIKYITHPIPEFEPAIYTNISKTLLDNEKL